MISGVVPGVVSRIVRIPTRSKGVLAMSLDLFATLDAEWQTVTSSRAARDAVCTWASDPVLRSLRDLDDVLVRTVAGSNRADADATLRALVRRAPDDDVAARAVLQALIPGLAGVARRLGASRDDDVAAEVIGAAWARIRSYPWQRRQGSVAGNLILDVLHVLWAARKRTADLAVEPDDLARIAVDEPPSPSTLPTARDVLETVAISGRVPACQLQLVGEAVLDRVPVSEAARRAGISTKAMTRRRERARASVVRAYVLAEPA